MRIPVDGEASVQSVNPYGDTRPVLIKPDTRLVDAVGSIGDAAKTAGGIIASSIERDKARDASLKARALAEAEAERKRAVELRIADGLVEVDRRSNAIVARHAREQSGIQAIESSGDYIKEVDKVVVDVGGRFKDPRESEQFRVRASSATLGPIQVIETRTTSQFMAAVKQAHGNQRDVVLRAASQGDLTQDQMAALLNQADLGADGLMSVGEAREAKLALRGDVSEVVINRRIGLGRVDEADAQLKLDAGLLGDKRAGNLRKLSESRRDADKKDAVDLLAQSTASGVAEAARNPYGFVSRADENRLRLAASRFPADMQKQTVAAAERAINVEGERRTAIVEGWIQEARDLRRKGGSRAIKAGLRARLELDKLGQNYLDDIAKDDEHDRDRNNARRDQLEAREDRKAARDARGEATDADKAQKKANELALTDMQGLSWREQSTYEKTHGLDGMGLDAQGKADMRKQQQNALNHVESKHSGAKEKLDKALEPVLKLAKGVSPALAARIAADAAERLEAIIVKEGREATPDERAAIIATVATRMFTKPGRIFGTNREFPVEKKEREGTPAFVSESKPSAQKRVVSWLVSKDRKTRKPRYDDGSIGPLEQVP